MDTVNYLLLCEGYSYKGGNISSVRGFVSLANARAAMVKKCKQLLTSYQIPVSSNTPLNEYTIRTKDSIRLEYNGDWFEWKIIKAVPEDGQSSEPDGDQWRGLVSYTVTIEEHVAQEFSIRAYDIFDAINSATEEYKKGKLVIQPAPPNTRLIMARDDETGDTTEWKEF